MEPELAAFCREEHPRLVGALSLYCGDRDVAEELAQEAVLRAVDRWSKVRVMDAPRAWLHRVGVNLVHSWFRRRQAERRATHRLGRGDDHQPDADRADVVAVRELVAGLPRRQRACIVWRFYLGWPVADVAATLGVSDQAVAALTQRALKALRAELGEDRVPELEEARHER